MPKPLRQFAHWLEHQLWQRDLAQTNTWHRGVVRAARMTAMLARDMWDGQLTLRAMSMVYTTLLSLVPLLAFSFSVLKGFGVHNQIEPLLFTFLEPLGPRGQEIGRNLIGFVDNVKVGVLGSVGLVLLLWTVISLIHKVESGFNYVWRVRQSRNLVQRLSGYISVLLIGPLLMVSAIGITATITSNSVVQRLLAIEPFGSLMVLGGKLVPYLMVIIAFTICYLFIPNTRVRPGAALIGGVVAGILWETVGKLFASFVAGSTNYTAIYSGFAIVLLSMIWLYVSWLILLLGAQIAFYQQNPRYLLRHRIKVNLGNRLREKLALAVMYHVAKNYTDGAPALTPETLGSELGVAGEALAGVIDRLQDNRLLLSLEDGGGLVPGRAADTIRVSDILATARDTDRETDHPEESLRLHDAVAQTIQQTEQAMYDAVGERSLRDLLAEK